jgi:phosphate transport system permease protein
MRTEGSLNPDATRIANLSSAVLIVMVLSFTLLARYLGRKYEAGTEGSQV